MQDNVIQFRQNQKAVFPYIADHGRSEYVGNIGEVPFILQMQSKMEALAEVAAHAAFHRGYRDGVVDGSMAWMMFAALTFAVGIVFGLAL